MRHLSLLSLLGLALLLAALAAGSRDQALAAPESQPPPAPLAQPFWPDIGFRLVAGGFSQPVHVTHDGTPGILYVVEQGGRVWRVATAGGTPQLWLDLTGQVNGCYECGLLSIAFPPGYSAPGRFYTNHTRGQAGEVPPTADSPLETVITRWRTLADGRVDPSPAAREEILVISQPYEMHNGGHILFGPDGMLWIAMGDGGDEGVDVTKPDPGYWDPFNYAQHRSPDPGNRKFLGKLLRIDVSPPTGYAIPPDNPLFDGVRDEIWAFGLRNPWRIWIDPPTSLLFIGDVGNLSREEINRVPASRPPGADGFNFQWSCLEGNQREDYGACWAYGMGPGIQAGPAETYGRDEGESVTGGVLHRGPGGALPGVYLFGDFQSGRLWGMKQLPDASWTTTILKDQTGYAIVSFGTDAAGNTYLVDYQFGGQGRVLQVVEGGCLPGDVCQYLPVVLKGVSGNW